MPQGFQSWPDLEPPIAEVLRTLPVVEFPAGAVLFEEHSPCGGFPWILEGEVKVSRHSEDGRTLELYRIGAGEICLVSAACLFRQQPLAGRGVTCRPTRLLMVPPDVFLRWLQSPGFRQEILGMFAERMTELASLIDAVAFHQLDQRLADALLGHGRQWQVTHQAIAEQLGTVREIVTRLLKRFEDEGWVELSRERIVIRDAAALREVASRLRRLRTAV